MPPTFESRIDLAPLEQQVRAIREAVSRVIVGQQEMIDLMIAAFLMKGHVLIEGVPGIAKTLAARALASCTDAGFSRIQFTPDLMPSDVIGTSVFNLKTSDFAFHAGPIFSNVILIDEINRAPAKTQSALFEVMEERQATVDGTTYAMAQPFIVMATQNPLEHEGTYKLPEAQLDRFAFKIIAHYPGFEEEIEILQRFTTRSVEAELKRVQPVLAKAEWLRLQELVQQVRVEPQLLNYIARIIRDTRQHHALYLGASPRAGLAVMNGARAWAAMHGRDFVTPDDIRTIVVPALQHRLLLTAEKEMEGLTVSKVLSQILDQLEVPR